LTRKKKIAPPKSAADIKRFLGEVKKHPDTVELLKRMAGYEAEVRKRGVKHVEMWSRLRHCWDGEFAQRRRKVHERIIKRLLTLGSKAAGHAAPLAVVIIGAPGSGKTSSALPLAQRTLNVSFTPVNPDDVKEQLPEYEGWNSTPLHDESAMVAELQLREEANAGRHHVVYDIVGRDTQKVLAAVQRFGSFGYQVYAMLTDLPSWLAAGRAWERFQRNPFARKSGSPGRYVPPDYVFSVGSAPLNTFKQLKTSGLLQAYCHLDMNIPEGDPPIVIDSFQWPGI
jgi:hypothetical protein